MGHRSAMIRALWIVLLVAIPAWATIIVMPTDGELVDQSPLVVVADVQATVPIERSGAIWTETTLRVVSVLKGSVSGGTIVVREIGGELGDRRTVVFGSPRYFAGDRVLVFLWPTPRGDYQTRDLFLGEFVERRVNGVRVWGREGDREGTLLLDRSFRKIDPRTELRDANSFERFVRDRASGRSITAVTPVIDRSPARVASPKFVLIDEPTVYRWFAFDEGESVGWWSVGSQNGYADGGTSEIERAISAWSGYSSAKIDYRFEGASDQHPGGLGSPNGLNEIMFEDPLDEIDGHWTGSSGVLGRGGFNEVHGPKTWTSGFRADAQHPQATFADTWEIVEADIVIQDGVSPSTGIDANELAELIAHELGHTLGLGHSADPTALMFASLTGRGPTLSQDDEDAARWLYPAGPYPAPPTSPTGLSVVSAVDQAVTLHWVDRAGNETGQVIYMAQGPSEEFQVAERVGANVTTATVSGLEGGVAYEFYVVARNDGGESNPSNVVSVTTPVTAVVADFSVLPPTGIAGVTRFSFVDRSAGPVESWFWTFGDGWSSASSTPSHRYTLPGHYQVALRVEGAGGQQSVATHELIVTAALQPVIAQFDAETDIHSGTATRFVDRSAGSPTWWRWQFGDGATSTEQSPSHVYAARGSYVVTLTAGNDAGTSSATREIAVGPSLFNAILPVSGRVVGANQTEWKTDLALMNDGLESANVTLTFLPADGGAEIDRAIAIGTGETRYWSDALGELFGIAKGAGAIAIRAESVGGDTPRVVIAERIYTRDESGTFGQYVPAIFPSAEGVRFLAGLRSDSGARTNIGLVNSTSEAAVAHLTLRDEGGAPIGTANVSLPPRRFRQSGLREIFPALTTSGTGRFSLVIETAPGIISYASVVDNQSQDPTLFASAAAPAARLVVPVAARTAGVNGTYWRSELALFNPLDKNVAVTASLLDGSDARSLVLSPHASVALDDALGWVGSAVPGGAMALQTDHDGVVVESRVYTSRTDQGTFGEAVPPSTMSDLGGRFAIAGLFDDGDFRTNVGLVNDGANPVDVSMELLDAAGRTIGTANLRMAGKAFFQEALTMLFSGTGNAVEPLSLRIIASTPTVVAWASVVDNHSGDPTLIPGQ